MSGAYLVAGMIVAALQLTIAKGMLKHLQSPSHNTE